MSTAESQSDGESLRQIEIARTKINDHVNERNSVDHDNLDPLKESIKKNGLAQPLVVREIGDEDDALRWEVVVGQRRFNACADIEDMDKAPARVVEWDDKKTRVQSIAENADVFKERVDPEDRARAMWDLWVEMREDDEEAINITAVAEEIAVNTSTVSRWIEPLRETWKGTKYDPRKDPTVPPSEHPDGEAADDSSDEATGEAEQEDEDSEEELSFDEEMEQRVESQTPSPRKMSVARRIADTDEEAVEIADRLRESGLPDHEAENVRKKVDYGASVDEAIEEVKEDYEEQMGETDSDDAGTDSDDAGTPSSDSEADADSDTDDDSASPDSDTGTEVADTDTAEDGVDVSDHDDVEPASTSNKIQVRFTLTGAEADKLERAAGEEQDAPDSVARQAVVDYLEDRYDTSE